MKAHFTVAVWRVSFWGVLSIRWHRSVWKWWLLTQQNDYEPRHLTDTFHCQNFLTHTYTKFSSLSFDVVPVNQRFQFIKFKVSLARLLECMMIIFVAPVLIKDVDWPYRPLTLAKNYFSLTNFSLGKRRSQVICAPYDDTIIATS